MAEVVAELERRFLPQLAEAAHQIERDFPPARARPWSAPVGSATANQGHTVGLECWFPDAPSDMPDSLGLDISVQHLTTTPELAEAYVAWNHPSGRARSTCSRLVISSRQGFFRTFGESDLLH